MLRLQPLVLVCAMLAGCLATRPEVLVSKYESSEPTAGLAEPGSIALFVAVAERPVGDRYLNHDLWEFADEQTPFRHDEFDRKLLLDQNGFRVGLLGGIPSGPFQNLLSARNCPDPRCIRLAVGTPTAIDVGEVWSTCDFQLIFKDQPHAVSLTQAQCRLQLLAHLDGTDKVRLVVTPMIRHGAQQLTPRAVQDPDGSRRWDLQVRHPEETYQWLNWTVTLGTNDYLVVGGRMDRTESLGRRLFLFTETKAPVQRVLVIRAIRQDQAVTLANRQDEAVPLALQAQAIPVPRVRSVAPGN